LRLAGLVLWISTFGYLIFPAYFQWAAMPLPSWLRWCGVITGALCSLLMYWTLSSLGKNLTDTVVTRAEAKLVTHGPYRWVRHPFYMTAALLMASVTVLTANWFIGFSSVAVLALLAIRTPKEEQMLIERFGQQYRDYMTMTGRFIPRIGR
jgi:protein-S-isoprenylcysteine O-methyltransferase Ste14